MQITWLSTHAIQYHVPVFREIAKAPDVQFRVVYLSSHSMRPTLDRNFGQNVKWDVPLTDGYEWEFAKGCNPDYMPAPPGRIPWFLHENLRATELLILTGWTLSGMWYANALARRKGIPVLHLSDSNNATHPRSAILKCAKPFLLSAYFGRNGYGLATGELSRRYFYEAGLPPSRVLTYPHVVDTSLFEHTQEQKQKWRHEVRQEHGIAPSATVFLFSGKWISPKAPDLLLEAFRQANLPNSHLILVGSGKLEAELRALASANVHFLGFHNQRALARTYCAADVIVLPSRHSETWGLVINECMQMGCAVIVSDRVGCHPDLVLNKQTGWVFPAEDVSALATCLRQAVADPQRLALYQRNAQAWIASFTPAHTARDLVAGCRQILARGEKKPPG